MYVVPIVALRASEVNLDLCISCGTHQVHTNKTKRSNLSLRLLVHALEHATMRGGRCSQISSTSSHVALRRRAGTRHSHSSSSSASALAQA